MVRVRVRVSVRVMVRFKCGTQLSVNTPRYAHLSPTPVGKTGFTSALLGVELDSEEQLLQRAERVYQTVDRLRIMPLGNVTQMTESERGRIAAWYQGLDKQP